MKTAVLVVAGSILFSSVGLFAQTAAATPASHPGAAPLMESPPKQSSAETAAGQDPAGELTIASGDLLEVSLFGTDFS
jgi:hypothetical protein